MATQRTETQKYNLHQEVKAEAARIEHYLAALNRHLAAYAKNGNFEEIELAQHAITKLKTP